MTRIELCLAHGSIEHVNARAIVLGVYRNVDPEGPFDIVDRALGGMVRKVITRRMFSADAGTLFLLPAARSGLRTDFVLLAGLGAFDRFDPEVLQTVGANIVRTLGGSNVDDFASVLIGAGSGLPPKQCLSGLLKGFLSALDESRGDGALQRITFCEINRARFRAIVRDAAPLVLRLRRDKKADITLRQSTIAGRRGPAGHPKVERARSPVYLLVRQDHRRNDDLVLSSALLTAGPHAAISTERMRVPQETLRVHVDALENRNVSPARLIAMGKALAEMTLPRSIRQQLAGLGGHHLAVVHDAAASRIPWEVLRIGSRAPALDGGISRRYTAANLSTARWAEPRQSSPELRMLLIENPTGDLEGAEAEAARIRALARRRKHLHVTGLQGRRATRAAVLDALRSEKYDVLHYAGHASFETDAPSRSGLRCADGVLSGEQLLGLGALPALLFFNACESARIRATQPRRSPEALRHTVGFAEALLRAGVANYVGTYWPVADQSAKRFSAVFYRQLLAGETVARALLDARRAVRRTRSADAVDWADYIHYGNPDFRVKIKA